jgi:1-deoxy-D-xylulose-5-phosphate synthase
MYQIGSSLAQIDSPKDLRSKFTKSDLPTISDELRAFLIDVISEIGNSHFSASMGVVELTVALHYVFDTPHDQLIWDIGHQAYGHKVLTERRTAFHTNRLLNGISGFPKRSESEYDTFGVGHASTSISALVGMAVASKYKGEKDKQHIAVIGDGALTGGMAFEGLNHAGSIQDANLLVILNDNSMAIDPNVGALKEYLLQITKEKTPQQNNFFEALNFQYFGPIDGHDVVALATKLEELKQIPGPKFLHCVTVKGKGYKYSEEGNPPQWHAPGVFNKETGEILKSPSLVAMPPKYQDVFGETIIELAQENDKIMGITPAMPTGCSLTKMMELMPERTFDVGIAEQHAVTFSAGLATQGLLPFCNIYSTFMQRAYDQVIHDVALQNLNVVFCLDRGGLVGADGATHHGVFDLAFFRAIPNMIVAAPMNEIELRNLMYTAQLPNKGSFCIRYPRGRGVTLDWKQPFEEVKVGTGKKISEGSHLAFLSIGAIGNYVQTAVRELAKKEVSAAHYDLRFVKPLDEKMLHTVFQKFDKIITVEDGCLAGGVGSAILEFMSDHNYSAKVIRLGIPDEFIEQGTQEELYKLCGYDVESMVKQGLELVKGK